MDEDLIAHLEKKIELLEADRDHWKSNHDNQVKLKQKISRRPSRFVEMVKQINELRTENKKLRDALQELLDFSDVIQGRHRVRSMQARIDAGALLNHETSSEK